MWLKSRQLHGRSFQFCLEFDDKVESRSLEVSRNRSIAVDSSVSLRFRPGCGRWIVLLSAYETGFVMDSIPRLETDRLQLRAVFPADSQAIFELMSDPKVAEHHELEPFETIRQADAMISNFTKWFQNSQAVRWAMIRKENERLIGTCCFDTFHPKYQSLNLGYNVRSDHWRQGYATEAIQTIIEYAFKNGIVGPVNRIQAITVPANVASEKVLERLGFEKEGLMREYGFWKGKFHDMNLFSLLKP